MRPLLEVPVDSLADALIADTRADRLELCDDLPSEGWSPSVSLVAGARKQCKATLVAMIRPRLPESVQAPTIDSFLASPRVIDASLREIESLARAGAHSVAIGLVRRDGSVDVDACASLVQCALGAGLEVAFHRAFDLAPNRADAMRDISSLGVTRVLSAGVLGWDASVSDLPTRLKVLACDRDCALGHAPLDSGPVLVMPGGGVRSHNAAEFLQVSSEIHSSCRCHGVIDRGELDRIAAVVSSFRLG